MYVLTYLFSCTFAPSSKHRWVTVASSFGIRGSRNLESTITGDQYRENHFLSMFEVRLEHHGHGEVRCTSTLAKLGYDRRVPDTWILTCINFQR